MKNKLNRRTLLNFILGYSLTQSLDAKLLCNITPKQPKGPFYKKKNLVNAVDMTNQGKAEGEIIEIKGSVVNTSCEPESFCLIKIWQANSFGKYNHKNDFSKNKADPNFKGYNTIRTNKNGFFHFTTILPGTYNISNNIIRPPHIHFFLKTKNNKELTTQLYFKNHPYNKNDLLFNSVKEKKLLEVSLIDSEESLFKTGNFNIVI